MVLLQIRWSADRQGVSACVRTLSPPPLSACVRPCRQSHHPTRSRATVFSSAAVGLCALSECFSPFPLARRHPTSCQRAQEMLDALSTMQWMPVQHRPALQPCPPAGCGWLPSAKCACLSPEHSTQRIAHVTRKSLTCPWLRVAYRTSDARPSTPTPHPTGKHRVPGRQSARRFTRRGAGRHR